MAEESAEGKGNGAERRVISVAIDGPSGAGKSTVARMAARKLGFVYADTGAMYRSVALFCLRGGVDVGDAPAVAAVSEKIDVSLDSEGRAFLNGEDVSGEICSREVSNAASRVSAIPAVRECMVKLQRDMAENVSIVMDGRDITTVVLPNAQVKVYLDADARTRAARRTAELTEKGTVVDFDTVLAEIIERDNQDSTRKESPLARSADSVYIDTSAITAEQAAGEITRLAFIAMNTE